MGDWNHDLQRVNEWSGALEAVRDMLPNLHKQIIKWGTVQQRLKDLVI